MWKLSVTCAVLCSVSSVAHSQSNVLLYGIIDEGVQFNSNAGGNRQYYLASGELNGSRWGLRGSEDLGSGLKALFVLENGFDVNTGKLGQGGLEFGRRAYVGLSSGLGTVTLGRQYDSVVDFVGLLEAGDQWAGYLGAHPADNDNFNNTNRVNNAVKYTSRSLGGFTFGGMYSLGGIAGDTTRNQIWSFGAGYANGPLVLGAAYLNVRNPNVSFYGSGGTVAPTTGGVPGSNFGSSPVISGYASARTLQVIGAGAAYTFGASTFGALYSNTRFKGLGDASSGPVSARGISGSATLNNVEVNFKYQFTPALLVGAEYVYTKGSGPDGVGDVSYHQGALGIDYFLSKRTDIYAVAAFQKASGTDSSGKPAVASLSQITPSSTDRQTALRLAIRHKF
ncbi:Outer membrane porin protein [Paraburkholderia domus]|jgi:Outer membrane protein (porin)|uniref:porin n=1 Tax=Paraburkholderia domus TaxID=2793075 RepID=UPI001912FACD|nr:porin [Paraburkholderia domus]MBK5051460.1 porin [Burkholderia sp. R-70006]CAE6786741.1 Outer membrane porin protein [Paraburkholderia domus]CAE6895962.1 Outer membrane porin protein [Paraburkholderia domus]